MAMGWKEPVKSATWGERHAGRMNRACRGPHRRWESFSRNSRTGLKATALADIGPMVGGDGDVAVCWPFSMKRALYSAVFRRNYFTLCFMLKNGRPHPGEAPGHQMALAEGVAERWFCELFHPPRGGGPGAGSLSLPLPHPEPSLHPGRRVVLSLIECCLGEVLRDLGGDQGSATILGGVWVRGLAHGVEAPGRAQEVERV